MTIEQIREKVASSEYDFLRTNEHLGGNIILLTLGGSHAYGMDKDDYAEKLGDDLAFEEEYKDMTNEEYDTMIDQEVRETEFVKAIVIYVG